MKRIVLPVFCTLLMAACQSAPKNAEAPKANKNAKQMEITGTITSGVSREPIVPTDPNVTVFPLDGPAKNPLTTDRTHSVLDNTTAGGYTVFDKSVTVYPLPGDDVPAYMPNYAVPPLGGNYKSPEEQGVGRPMGLASAGILPPVPNVEVNETKTKPPVTQARSPMSLTSPEPLTMQPPSQARKPMLSPFVDDDGAQAGKSTDRNAPKARAPMLSGYHDDVKEAAPKARGPMLSGYDDAAPVKPVAQTQTSSSSSTTVLLPGRKSAPLLTGY